MALSLQAKPTTTTTTPAQKNYQEMTQTVLPGGLNNTVAVEKDVPTASISGQRERLCNGWSEKVPAGRVGEQGLAWLSHCPTETVKTSRGVTSKALQVLKHKAAGPALRAASVPEPGRFLKRMVNTALVMSRAPWQQVFPYVGRSHQSKWVTHVLLWINRKGKTFSSPVSSLNLILSRKSRLVLSSVQLCVNTVRAQDRVGQTVSLCFPLVRAGDGKTTDSRGKFCPQ